MVAQAHMTIKIGRVLIGLTVLWSFLGLSGIESWAFDDETARATLRGVAGVQVVVERLKLEVERHGLTSQQLQTDVELRLRKAGIPVLTDQERRKIPGQPWLYVTVNVFLDSDELAGLVVFDIDVTLYQWASLDADASSAIVATWATAYFGRVGVRHLHTLREEVRDQVDRFINAYLSIHPRPTGSAAPSSTSPRRDLIRHVQERLQTVGFNPGTIDGAMGPQTQQALRWFQNANGFVATGDLDKPTLNALGIR